MLEYDYEFPSDNDLGIPTLPINAAATAIPAPVLCYGSFPRVRWHPGTTHFYTEDYRFARLRANPPSAVVVEPNYTTDATRASVICAVYRKRRAAWLWASAGAQIIVDLYVPIAHMDVALTGIPRGWPAYAWRATREEQPNDWDARLAVAQRHAGDRPIVVLVVGGGRRAAEWCAAHAAIHIAGLPRHNE